MSEIKASEISEILSQELLGLNVEKDFEEIGRVVEVGDGIARLYGLRGVEANELVDFESGVRGVVLNLEEDNVGVVLLGDGSLVKEGQRVRRTQGRGCHDPDRARSA